MMAEINMTGHQRLKLALRLAGSQEEVAARAGVHPATIRSLLRGRYMPQTRVAQSVAAAIGITPAELVAWSQDGAANRPGEG